MRGISLLLLCAAPAVRPAPFSGGSLAVFRVGVGGGLTSSSASGFIDEVAADTGALLQTIAIPTSVSFSPLDAAAGQLSRSQDNRTLLLGGFVAPPGTPAVDASNATAVRRVVVALTADGRVDTTSWVLPLDTFSGNGASSFGGVRAACARSASEGLFVSGIGAEPGGARVVQLRPDGTTLRLVPGAYLGCSVADDRLLAVASARGVDALEDRHSCEPGLPDEVDDEAFPPTARRVTDGVNDDGATAHALSGAGDGALWLARAPSGRGCRVQKWALADATPADFVEERGYLSAGNDLRYAQMTWYAARQWCIANATCAGFTVFWNVSDPAFGPYDKSRPVWTAIKGPFFYDNPPAAGADTAWWAKLHVGPLCVRGGGRVVGRRRAVRGGRRRAGGPRGGRLRRRGGRHALCHGL